MQTMKWRKLNTLETEKLNYWWALNSCKYRIGTHGEKEFIRTGFPGGSDGKESACNAVDFGLIPWLGKSPGDRNGYLLSPSWRIHGQRTQVGYNPWGCKDLETTELLTLQHLKK